MKLSQLNRDVALRLRDMTPTKRERFLFQTSVLAAGNRLARKRLALAERRGPAPTFPGLTNR